MPCEVGFVPEVKFECLIDIYRSFQAGDPLDVTLSKAMWVGGCALKSFRGQPVNVLSTVHFSTLEEAVTSFNDQLQQPHVATDVVTSQGFMDYLPYILEIIRLIMERKKNGG